MQRASFAITSWQEITALGGAYALQAILVGLGLYFLFPQRSWRLHTLWGRQRDRYVGWGLAQIGAVFFAWMVLDTVLVLIADMLGKRSQEDAATQIYVTAVAMPVRLLVSLWIIWRLGEVGPAQIGLHGYRWRQQLWIGYIHWLWVTPCVFLVHQGALLLNDWLGTPATPHPIEKILHGPMAWWQVLVVAWVVLIGAPVWEEFFFRGLLQPWLGRYPLVGDLVLLGHLVLLTGQAWERNSAWSVMLIPAIGLGYIAFDRLGKKRLAHPWQARAIYATSLLFATAHADIWPTPVPIFALSLALGWLRYRTQSLLASMVLHSLFNLTSLLAAFLRC